MVHDHQVFGGGITRTVTGEFSAEIMASPRTLFRSGSTTMPSAPSPAQISAREAMSFSPMPPVKTSMSRPPSSATKLPIHLAIVQVNLSTASRAFALPSLMASRRSRISLESSLTPSRPDFLLTMVSSLSAASAAFGVGLGDLVQDEDHDAGIDVAGARAADDAAGRREAHRGVEALAVADGGDGCAVAEVRDDQLLRNVGLQLVDDRLVGDAVVAVAAHAHRRVLLGNGHVGYDFRHGAMEVGIENSEVGNAGKEPQRLAHDVDGDGRVQRRKVRVALDLVDQFGSDELVFVHSGTAANRAMADGFGGRETRRSAARRQRA